MLAGGDDRAILTLPGALDSLTAAEVDGALERPAAPRVCATCTSRRCSCSRSLGGALPGAVWRRARAHGLTTSLDTNDDPAGAWQGVDALLPHLDVLLPNRAEVVALGRRRPTRAGAARALAARGPLVVVKDGAAGAFAVAPDGARRRGRRPSRAQAVDTTGAGDTFDAAFLDAWLDRSPLADCLARAVARRRAAASATSAAPPASRPATS